MRELNRNKKQGDSILAKLTSGQKFIGAQGNSASYAISEKMLEQIRSLFQDDQNIQNGSSMIKTAERGIDQIIQNLRTMKELAIDAANDSNTDDDRHIIQKEMQILQSAQSKLRLKKLWTRQQLWELIFNVWERLLQTSLPCVKMFKTPSRQSATPTWLKK